MNENKDKLPPVAVPVKVKADLSKVVKDLLTLHENEAQAVAHYADALAMESLLRPILNVRRLIEDAQSVYSPEEAGRIQRSLKSNIDGLTRCLRRVERGISMGLTYQHRLQPSSKRRHAEDL